MGGIPPIARRIALLFGILALPARTDAVPFSIIGPDMGMVINSAAIDPVTGFNIPLWLVAEEAIDLPAPGILSLATFEWAPGDPNNPLGSLSRGNWAYHEAQAFVGVTASIELRVGPNGAHLAAGQVLTDGTAFGFSNGYAAHLRQNETTITPDAAGLQLVMNIKGWPSDFDNMTTELLGHAAIMYGRFILGQDQMTWEMGFGFQPRGPLTTISQVSRRHSSGPTIGLPVNPTYIPIQVPEVSTVSVSATGIIVALLLHRQPKRRND